MGAGGKAPPSAPERTYLVQVLASVEVAAADRADAAALALAEIAHRCESGHDLFIRAEELR